ncbi:uncharacterized protein F5891DRAFT_979346 [Suillus fuscotomentosus]|uniref:Uncharacterized protein n=1 Tax=Suillus fuscotomentosus TaxID=1912939 RepID=A0AAD4HMD0_9AGAM|nr:uncharacterized protein F5891DRAFT_979346 [Suillus fuscotomentosus]KAG1901511.1 hypothetical protein F5891DRAFT_979346 [Suillus fuscotomentosus]
MDFEDHFTSHEYRGLYWTNFESFVEECNPSPECNQSSIIDDDTVPKISHSLSGDTEGALDEPNEEFEHRPVEGTLDDDGVYVEQLQNDKIRIGSDNFGNLMPKATQVMDYLHRDDKFSNICIWDFVAQVDKVKKSKKNKKTNWENMDDDETCYDDDIDDNEDELTNDTMLEDDTDNLENLDEMDIDETSQNTAFWRATNRGL